MSGVGRDETSAPESRDAVPGGRFGEPTVERAQEVQQFVGILPGDVEAHREVDRAELADELLETGAQLGVTDSGFDDLSTCHAQVQVVKILEEGRQYELSALDVAALHK